MVYAAMQLVQNLIKQSKFDRQRHLDLSEECLNRGGNSTVHKGVLAQFLNTNIPSGRILLCHACHNGLCSNPKHLYWGTDKENLDDAKQNGTFKNISQRTVEKYGLEQALEFQRRGDKTAGGKAGKGRRKSEEQKRKTSETLKNKANK